MKLAALILTLVLTTPRPATRETFITHKIANNGAVLAVPTHAVGMWLRPDNAVARAIHVGEALTCRVSDRITEVVVEREPAQVHSVVLDCDGAKYTILGLQFEGVE